MKKYLFLIFAVTMLLFCSASHEAFSGTSPPALSQISDDYNEISVPGFTTISSLENVDNNDVVYNAAIAVEEANYSILTSNSNKLYLNPESPVVVNNSQNATLLSNNKFILFKYAAISRKFVIKNDSYFYNSTNGHNEPIISGMQFRSSLWN